MKTLVGITSYNTHLVYDLCNILKPSQPSGYLYRNITTMIAGS
jgi:hypothetical protein